MSKRFTDSGKWRNPWFRTLPIKAKLTWIYMCDDCDYSGIWKPDFGLASFQLDFKIELANILEWFGDKVRPFRDCILIVQFFEFQYGDSKDTWSAKAKAKSRLESFGFVIEDNKIVSDLSASPDHYPPTVVPQSPHSGDTVLSIGIVKGIGIVVGKGKNDFDFEKIYKSYPRKGDKSEGIERLKSFITSQEDFDALTKAVSNYAKHCELNGTEEKYIKQFTTFVGTAKVQRWKDYVDFIPKLETKSANKKQSNPPANERNESLEAQFGGNND